MATSSLILNLIVRNQGGTAGIGAVTKGFTALHAAGLAAGAGMVAAVAGAASFDQTIRQVGAAAKVPAEGMKSLSELALKMGADTSFSAKQAADAMLELAKGGITEAQIKAGVLDSTLTLAAAGGLELGAAATYMSNALNGFGLQAADSAKVSAAFAGAANASTASVEPIGQAMAQIGPIAAAAGFSIEDTTAALAAFDDNMLKGSDAGTSLKAMFNGLIPTTTAQRNLFSDLGLVTVGSEEALRGLAARGIHPVSNSLDDVNAALAQYVEASGQGAVGSAVNNREVAKLGIELGATQNAFFDATGKVKSFADMSGLLREKLGGLTAEQRLATTEQLFGTDAMRAAMVMSGLSKEKVAEYAAATRDLGAAQAMAKVNTSGAAGAFEAFKGSVETLGLRIGLALLPAVERVTRAATTLVNDLGTAFEGALGVVAKFRSGIASGPNPFEPMVAQVRGIASTIGSVIKDSLMPAARNLVALFDPLVVEALRKVADITQKYLLPAVRGVAEFFQNVLGPALRVVTGFLADNKIAIQSFVVAVGAFIAVVKAAAVAQAAWTAVMAAGPAIMAIVRVAMLNLRLAILAINAAFMTNPILIVVAALAALAAGLVYAYKHSETFRRIVDAAFSAVKSVALDLWGWIKSNWPPLWDGVKVAVSAAMGVVRTVVSAAFTAIKLAWTNVLAPMFEVLKFEVGLVAAAFRIYFNVISTVVRTAFTVVKAVWTTVLQPLFQVVKFEAGLVAAAFRLYFNVISTVVRAAFTAIKFVWDTVLMPAFAAVKLYAAGLAAAFRLYFGVVSAVVRAAFDVIRAVWATVLSPTFDAVKSGARGVSAVFTASFDAVGTVFRSTVSGIRTLWSSVLMPVFARMQEGIGNVRDGFADALKKIREVFGSAVGAIERSWDRLRDIVEAPAKFVVNNVLKPLAGALKKVAGIFGIGGKINADISWSGGSSGGGGGGGRSMAGGRTAFATGGIMPGYTPGRDNQLIAVGGGEAIMRPEWTRAVGSGYVHAMNGLARAGGVGAVQKAMGLQGFDLGGIVGAIKDKVTGAARGAVNLAQNAWDFVSDPAAIMTRMLNPALGALGSKMIPGGPYGDMLRQMPKTLVGWLVDTAQEKIGGLFGGLFGGGGVGNWGTAEQQRNAQSIISVGRAVGASQRDLLIALMTALQESGLRNLNYGDRDSVGLFQQRTPWGPLSARMDPRESARMFFRGGRGGQPGLFSYGGRDGMSLSAAAQAVQRSAFPDAYAKWEDEARKLLMGGATGGAMAGGQFNPGLMGALAFARANAGEPYIWGGVGPYGFDCSGFMGAIQGVIQGNYPYVRRYTTHSFFGGIPGGWAPGGGGAFSVGVVPQRGSTPGHMAGTLNGVNVESRGGRGTLVGPAARGTNNGLFTRRFHLAGYAGGGVVGDPPYDLLGPARKQVGFDSGGLAAGAGWMPKFTTAPERVLSPAQTAAFESWMGGGSGGRELHVHVTNHGVIGSRMEVENWLTGALVSLDKQGRLPNGRP